MPSLAKSNDIAVLNAAWNIAHVGEKVTKKAVVEWLAEVMGEGAPSKNTVDRCLNSLFNRGVFSRVVGVDNAYVYSIVNDRAIEYVLIEQSPLSTYYDALNEMVDQGGVFRVGDKYCWNVKRWLNTPELYAALVFMSNESGKSIKDIVKDMKKPRTAAEFRQSFS